MELTSIRKAGTMVRGILAMTMKRATKRDSPLNTGFKIRVEKYMTVRVGVSWPAMYRRVGEACSPGEIPQVC